MLEIELINIYKCIDTFFEGGHFMIENKKKIKIKKIYFGINISILE